MVTLHCYVLQESYKTYLEEDVEVVQMIEQITRVVQENAEECLRFYGLFTDYHFLWEQDVNQTFEEFLRGHLSPNPLRPSTKSEANNLRRLASAKSMASRSDIKITFHNKIK